jgi:hypothetical protein
MSNYTSIVSVRAPRSRIDTSTLFDSTYSEANDSPVDQFLKNSLLLNMHWTALPEDRDLAPELSRLLLIGYASAVEGYMRSLIRRLVHIDPFTRNICSTFQVSFAAAVHHSPDLLPDALLEETSFSTQEVIPKTLQKFIGFSSKSASTKLLLEDFDALMQLRHCCTHRFGKLGAKNAIALGLQSHSALLEKPVKIDKIAMGSIADIAFSLVKSINNDVWAFVIERTATGRLPSRVEPGIGWTWHKSRDRARFDSYYQIFRSLQDATPSPSAGSIYNLFRDTHKRVGS